MLGCSLTNLDLAAQIRWLPKREKILEKFPEQIPSSLDEDAFGHPVLIVTKGIDEKGRVVVLLMTSFGNQDIRKKFPEPDQQRNREKYWPIDPTPVHPDHGNLLKLRDERPMDKEYSYVNSKGSYPIRYDILEPYKPEDPEDIWMLEEKSYEKLTRGRDYAKFHSGSWRREGEGIPPPLPQPLMEREEEGKQASTTKHAGTLAIRSKTQKECYEAMKNSLAWDEYPDCIYVGYQMDDPDP